MHDPLHGPGVDGMSARCRSTPSTCMDDLCRNSPVGLCGNEDFDEFDDPDDLYYIDTQWDFESGNPREGW